MAVTTTQFLDRVKKRISMPENQVLLNDSDILNLGDDCLKAYVVPSMISVRQDFFVYTQDVQFVDGQSEYDIPYRAVGRSLRDLKIVDNTVSSNAIRDVIKVELEDAHIFSNDDSATTPYGFHFIGDRIKILPTPSSTTTSARFFFELPPNKLVALSAAGLITGISGGDITLDAVPTTFSTSQANDFIAGRQGNYTKAIDKTPTNVAGTTLTYATADIPTNLAVGDYIAVAEESPVIQIPDDAVPWLVTKTARRVLYTISDFEGYKALEDDDKEEEKRLKMVLEPRIRGESTKIVNRYGLVRQGRRLFGRRGVIF